MLRTAVLPGLETGFAFLRRLMEASQLVGAARLVAGGCFDIRTSVISTNRGKTLDTVVNFFRSNCTLYASC